MKKFYQNCSPQAKNLPILFRVGLLLLFMLNACKKEIVAPTITDFNVNATELGQVRQWFNNSDNLQLFASSKNWLNKTNVNWTKAYSSQTTTQTVYEINVNNPDRIFATSGTIDVKQIEAYEKRCLIRLLVFEELLTGEKSSCFMIMVADQAHDLKKTPLSTLHYKNYKEFTGLVDFYSLDGDLVNGWALSNGKIIKTRKQGVAITTKTTSQQKVMYMAPPEDCTTREEPRWRQQCIIVYPIEGMGGEPVTTCTPEMYYVTVVLSCPETGGDGGYTPPNNPPGNPGNPDPPTEPDSLKNPCDQAAKLAQDTKFKQLMTNLKAKTNDNKENGYYYKNSAAGSPENETAIEGVVGEGAIDFTPSNKIDGVMHSHYTGLLSIFSASDIWSMANLYKNGKMVNPKTFTLTVVTASGTQYMLKIDDLTKFNAYATELASAPDAKPLEKAMSTQPFSILETGRSPDQNEKAFLQFLQLSKSGLRVFKGNATFTDWKAKKITNGSVVNNPCAPILEE